MEVSSANGVSMITGAGKCARSNKKNNNRAAQDVSSQQQITKTYKLPSGCKHELWSES